MKKSMNFPECFRLSVSSFLGGLLLLCVLSVPLFGQGTTPPALQFLANIPIPNWTTSGATAASFDALWFNPQNGVVYIADRVNDGATAVDTKTWTYLGTSKGIGCGIQTIAASTNGRSDCRPSGIIVTQDSQKVVVTAPGPTAANPKAPPPGVWIFDLRAPATAPVLVQTQLGPDFLEYDPVNHLLYVKTNSATGSANTLAVVDPVAGKLVTEVPLTVGIEQLHFNPVDGFIYIAVTDAGKQAMIKFDPNNNTVVASFPLNGSSATCTGHQFEIDPITDVAVMGCSEAAIAVDLHNGNIVGTYPLQVNSDTTGFNLNLRHMYVTSTTGAAASGCPKDSTGSWPAIGVVSTVPGNATAGQSPFVGFACGGRGEKGGVADFINHNVYVATPQYPVDANSASTGQAGLLVFHDPGAIVSGAPANTLQAASQTNLSATAGSGVSGSVIFTLRRRSMFVDGNITGLAASSSNTDLIITTTAGTEMVHCGVNGSGTGFCQGRLYGDPLVGGVVDVGSGGKLVASGPITLGATIPTFISTDSYLPEE